MHVLSMCTVRSTGIVSKRVFTTKNDDEILHARFLLELKRNISRQHAHTKYGVPQITKDTQLVNSLQQAIFDRPRQLFFTDVYKLNYSRVFNEHVSAAIQSGPKRRTMAIFSQQELAFVSEANGVTSRSASMYGDAFQRMWEVTATVNTGNVRMGDVQAYAVIEGQHNFNMFGTQFHPEVAKGFSTETTLGGPLEFSHYFSRFVASRLHLNTHHFPLPEMAENLMILQQASVLRNGIYWFVQKNGDADDSSSDSEEDDSPHPSDHPKHQFFPTFRSPYARMSRFVRDRSYEGVVLAGVLIISVIVGRISHALLQKHCRFSPGGHERERDTKG